MVIWIANKISSAIRRKKVAQIGQTIGWQFQPEYQFTSLQDVPEGDEINILSGEIEGIPARIFDLPKNTSLDVGQNKLFATTYPETILLITFPSGKIPWFKLRPKAIGDGFIISSIANKRYIIEVTQRDKLKQLFTQQNLTHFSQQKGLYIEGNLNKIRVQFNPHTYLPTQKENYVNLIAEGEFITSIVKVYLDSNLSL